MNSRSNFDITPSEIEALHTLIVNTFSGIYDLRDPQGLDNVFKLYKASQASTSPILSKAAALLYGIIHYQPFINCNRRTAIISTATFLMMSGYQFQCNKEECLEFIKNIETTRVSREEVKDWITEHSIPLDGIGCHHLFI